MFELIRKVVKIRSWTLVIVTSIFYLASSFIIYFLEPDNFENPFNGFWWVMTTVTTVGYGDLSPETVLGKLYGMLLYLFGIGLIGIIIGKIVDSFSLYRTLKVEGKLKYKGNNHHIMVGWSQRSKMTIEELLLSKHITNDIVLIDQLQETPFEHERFHFIQGDPTETDILQKANVLESKSVSIFSPQNVDDEISSDGKSLLVASFIENFGIENGKNIYTIVEIAKEKHINIFKNINIDEFILSNEAFPSLMAKSMIHKGSSQLFMQLLSKKYGDDLWEVKRKSSWITYDDAYEDLKRQGAILLSDGADFSIIRRLKDNISDHARLFIVCDEKTYDKIETNR